ncbi:hypothetical protein VU05_05565, partial [Desulfobulbus sp. F1]|nr:hypothetical protein [Desulfobulbus sp. F1]
MADSEAVSPKKIIDPQLSHEVADHKSLCFSMTPTLKGVFFMRNYFALLLLSSSLSCFCSIANGQQEMAPCGQPWNSSLAAVEGTIDRVYFAVPPGSGKEGLHVDIKTLYGDKVTAHVFPRNCVEINPEKFIFRAGDDITIFGSLFFTENKRKRNICSAIIFRNSNKSLELRDPDSGKMDYTLCNNCS